MRCQDDVVRIRPSPSVHADRHLSACKADHFGKTVPQGRQAVNHGIWRDISRRKTLENTTFSYRMLPNPGFQFPPPPPKCLILLNFWRRTVFASTSIGLFLTRAACATPRTKARVVNPLPSILEHTFLHLNPQLHSAVGSLAECLGRSSRPLLNAAPLPLSSLLLRGYDELNALFLNGSILSHCS